MTSVLTVTVEGLPAPQGSKAVVPTRDGRIWLRESSDRVKPWRATVKAAAAQARGRRAMLTGPIAIEITFLMPRPTGHVGTGRNAGTLRKSAPMWPVTRPDVDKLARAVLDALSGTWFHDDSQIVVLTAFKTYAGPNTAAGARITARTVKD